jgi:hypothetical protein
MMKHAAMEELARAADEYDVTAWVAWDDRFEWIVLAKTPFHDQPVILRTPDDLLCVIAEIFMRESDERAEPEPDDFVVDSSRA